MRRKAAPGDARRYSAALRAAGRPCGRWHSAAPRRRGEDNIRALALIKRFCRGESPCKLFCHPISLVLPKETGVAPQRKTRRSQRRVRNLCNLSPLQPLTTGARATERQRQRNAAKDRQGRRGGARNHPPNKTARGPPSAPGRARRLNHGGRAGKASSRPERRTATRRERAATAQ